jgi:hypothetical protein
MTFQQPASPSLFFGELELLTVMFSGDTPENKKSAAKERITFCAFTIVFPSVEAAVSVAATDRSHISECSEPESEVKLC